jgi:hypothetical protein
MLLAVKHEYSARIRGLPRATLLKKFSDFPVPSRDVPARESLVFDIPTGNTNKEWASSILFLLWCYTQSGDCQFQAYIPSLWKNQPWLVRVGGARRTKLQCTLLLRGQIHSLCFISTLFVLYGVTYWKEEHQSEDDPAHHWQNNRRNLCNKEYL